MFANNMSCETSGSATPVLSLTRTIHPVGQGAFYSESLSSESSSQPFFTAVYDCGGKAQCRKTEIGKISGLDILFISHFHDDHISGVKSLLERYPQANVYIPGVSHCRFVVDLIGNFLRTSSATSPSIEFMLSCIPALKAPGSPFYPFAGQTNGGMTKGQILAIPLFTVPKSIPVPQKSPVWLYDAYYSEYGTSKEKELIEKLSEVIPSLKVLLSGKDVYRDFKWYQQLLDEMTAAANNKDGFDNLHKIYNAVFGHNHNPYSMIVHSHPLPGRDEKQRVDCLFTGDAESMSLSQVLRAIPDPKPRYVQVPHHGASANHEINNYSHHPTAFISVGEKNQYNHPGVDTVAGILRKCPDVYVVTEDADTKYWRRFEI